MLNQKTLAKNTLFLYFRMIITMAIGIFSSRLVLQVLGVQDYGLYNIVSGVVASFSFLSATISSANARFLAFEIGKGKKETIKEVFSLCLTSSFLVAVIIVILCETIGLWWLNNKLNIPEESVFVANLIYQISILGMFLSFVISPFNSVIIAYEHIKIFAFTSVITSVLNLLFLIILKNIDVTLNKVIIYAAALVAVNICVYIYYIYYSKINFEITNFTLKYNNKIKEIFAYSGWDLYGNFSVMTRTTGIAILQNMFFGLTINAAIGVASLVQSVVNSFASNIHVASRPQITKSYATGNHTYMMDLMNKTAKYSVLLLCIIIVPVLLEIDFLLKIWLGTVPQYTSSLIVYFLLFILGANVSQCLMIGIHASGKIKRSSIINGSLYLLVLPISYFAFKYGNVHPKFPYILNFLFVLIGGGLNSFYLKQILPEFNILNFYSKNILPVICIAVIVYILLYNIISNFDSSYYRIILVGASSVSIMVVFSWFFLLEKEAKDFLKDKICVTRR